MYLTNTLQSQNLNFIALLFYLITGALERSTFSSGDWFKGFLLLGTNYDSAWFYDLSLQHPPTLWARSEGSSVSIVDLHCTWGQIHTTTEIKIMYFTVFDLAVEHIANFWQQVCMACSFDIPVSRFSTALIQSLSDLPGCKMIRLSSNIKHIRQFQHFLSEPMQQLLGKVTLYKVKLHLTSQSSYHAVHLWKAASS